MVSTSQYMGFRAKTALTLGSGWKQYQQYQQELFKELTDKLDLETFGILEQQASHQS